MPTKTPITLDETKAVPSPIRRHAKKSAAKKSSPTVTAVQKYQSLKDPAFPKVALVGSASKSLKACPWGAEGFEFWCLAWRQDMPKYNRLFEMHEWNFDKTRRRTEIFGEEYEPFLNSRNCPVYAPIEVPGISTIIKYPILEVIEFMKSFDDNHDGDYFTSSIGYMMALAMFEGFKEIHLYGIDLLDDSEYPHQRPNLEYLIGLARGSGVKVHIPKASALCKNPMRYGYIKELDYGPFNKALLADRIRQYEEQRLDAVAKVHTYEGALQEAEQLIQRMNHFERGAYEDE